jgi:MarR family transcriptional regulator for hemolysin
VAYCNQDNIIRHEDADMDKPAIERNETVDTNVGFLIHDSARLMRINYDRRMRELGLTRSQWWVLTHLFFQDGISQTELSGILEIERATLGRLLDRLEEKGWIERRPDANDRRIKRVFLTGEVGDLMRVMRSLASDLRAEALAGLNDREQAEFIRLMTKIKGNLLQMLESDAQTKEASNG